MFAWRTDPTSWDVAKLGGPPGSREFRGPFEAVKAFNAGVEEIETSAALTEREIADQDNRRLLEQAGRACGFNILSEMDDAGPLLAMLNSGVDRCLILRTLCEYDPKGRRPPPKPLSSWRDSKFLQEIGLAHAHSIAMGLVPGAVKSWSEAAEVWVPPAPRRRGGASRSPEDVQGALGQEVSPTAFATAQGVRDIDPVTRATLASYCSGGDDGRPWVAPQRPEEGLSVEFWDEVLGAVREGVLAWSERWGPEPTDRNCRAPAHLLRIHGFR